MSEGRGRPDESASPELAWRETTLYRFTDPADRAALLRVGRLLHLQALDQPAGGGPSAIHAELRAVARDLRNLQSFLEMVWREGDDTELGASGVELMQSAGTWGQKVGRIAKSIERELGTTRSRQASELTNLGEVANRVPADRDSRGIDPTASSKPH
jgi:hypothetical protein